MPKESIPASDGETTKDEGTNSMDEFHDLDDHEVRRLDMVSDAPLYDGTKSIKEFHLSSFFKIMNIIITKKIDMWLYKTEGNID